MGRGLLELAHRFRSLRVVVHRLAVRFAVLAFFSCRRQLASRNRGVIAARVHYFELRELTAHGCCICARGTRTRFKLGRFLVTANGVDSLLRLAGVGFTFRHTCFLSPVGWLDSHCRARRGSHPWLHRFGVLAVGANRFLKTRAIITRPRSTAVNGLTSFKISKRFDFQ